MNVKPLRDLEDLFKRKAAAQVLLSLVDGPLRWTDIVLAVCDELGERVPDVTVTRAKEALEDSDLITGKPLYHLTEEGKQLAGVLARLVDGVAVDTHHNTDPSTGWDAAWGDSAEFRTQEEPPPELDTGIPHSARMYDYWLGGKDNFAADREMAEMFLQQIPSLREMAKENRNFVTRVTEFLSSAGIRQFLDVGTGIPTSPNLHETAQRLAPESRVAYVDNDPIVLAHARALMTSSDPGRVIYLDADLRRPGDILGNHDLADVLDLEQPIALMLIAVLMLIGDSDDPYGTVAALRDAMPSGSYLALTHPTQDFNPDAMQAVTKAAVGGGMTFVPRSRNDVERFFGDWELVPPGLVPVLSWRPLRTPPDARAAYYWSGVARKP